MFVRQWKDGDGGGGGGLQSSTEGRGGDATNPATNGALGCGGGGAGFNTGGFTSDAGNGGDGYVNLTIVPL